MGSVTVGSLLSSITVSSLPVSVTAGSLLGSTVCPPSAKATHVAITNSNARIMIFLISAASSLLPLLYQHFPKKQLLREVFLVSHEALRAVAVDSFLVIQTICQIRLLSEP
jgi:hypothetical protein